MVPWTAAFRPRARAVRLAPPAPGLPRRGRLRGGLRCRLPRLAPARRTAATTSALPQSSAPFFYFPPSASRRGRSATVWEASWRASHGPRPGPDVTVRPDRPGLVAASLNRPGGCGVGNPFGQNRRGRQSARRGWGGRFGAGPRTAAGQQTAGWPSAAPIAQVQAPRPQAVPGLVRPGSAVGAGPAGRPRQHLTPPGQPGTSTNHLSRLFPPADLRRDPYIPTTRGNTAAETASASTFPSAARSIRGSNHSTADRLRTPRADLWVGRP